MKNRVGFSINWNRCGAWVFQCRIACIPYLFTPLSLHAGPSCGCFVDLLVGGLLGQPPQVELQLTGRQSATLFLTRIGERRIAVLAQRQR